MTEDGNGTIWRIAYTKPILSARIVEDNGQRNLVVTVTRPSGVNSTVEVSSDLLTWARPAEIVTLSEAPTQLVLRDNTPIQNGTTPFIRLRVSTQ